MEKSNGGLAFPFTPTDRSGQCSDAHPGMTLRQFYIAHALQGLCANTNVLSTEINEDEVTAIGSCAVAIADRALESERVNDEAEALERAG